jgi:hypothetical protein
MERLTMNEPAYPFTEMHTHGHPYTQWKGMTLRDYFAAKAMQPINSQARDYAKAEANDMARKAYMIADAMLKARQE